MVVYPGAVLVLAILGSALAFGAESAATDRIRLPIEVVGMNGSTRSQVVSLPAGRSKDVRTLWLQIHGLEYDNLASVALNGSNWLPLNNHSVSVAEPGRSFGGIGGGFATLKMTLGLPAGAVTDGANDLRFRFNQTDGVVSGFRVIAFNFLDAEGRAILPESAFVQEEPNTWKAPLSDPADIAAGANLWRHGALKANGLANAGPIRAHCGDCHTADGRDLKYFNYSNESIVARSRFHGLTFEEGQQIASYIRSLPYANPGRPWNPPYQPGPGIDTQPIESWAAGAGIAAALEKDDDALAYLFRGRISAEAFRPDGHLNASEIPIAMQLPDWNHWLPHIHPLDAWGESFDGSEFSAEYDEPALHASDDAAAYFERWGKAQHAFLARHVPRTADKWSPGLMQDIYSSQLWQLVKTWEITQDLQLERTGGRSWPNRVPALTAPTSAGIPDGPNGMGGSALTNEYYSNGWYELQLLLNDGGHRHNNELPVSWPVMAEHFLQLYQQSAKAEPGRLLIVIVKAMQSSDPHIGPEDRAHGWRPERNIDPRIMVDAQWTPMFAGLARRQKLAMTESLLEAWLEKNRQYAPGDYFERGATNHYSSRSYKVPDELRSISGGRAWEATTQFQAAGVRPDLMQRLADWGLAYQNLAQLFHY